METWADEVRRAVETVRREGYGAITIVVERGRVQFVRQEVSRRVHDPPPQGDDPARQSAQNRRG